MKRRDFLKTMAGGSLAAGSLLLLNQPAWSAGDPESPFRISLAQWSLHRTLFDGKLDHLDFAKTARRTYGIEAVEYVNQFFAGKAKDEAYLKEMKTRAEGEGVRSLLIMCDGEGRLGDPDPDKRRQAVENHYKWVEAAKFLGCHSIRVNAASEGTYEEQMKLAADGLHQLVTFGAEHGLNVIVENHGGLSSNGQWLSGVMKQVDHPRCGTLPDFGNFRIQGEEWYDRYQGVTELMPYAKAVSAKSHDFDSEGNETNTDYFRMMKIVLAAGYNGFVGIEYEGGGLSEHEGILATQRLLLRCREALAK
ncbi:MAG: TIM barrel protein [Calditrichaeota bacterium]|nr:TIM barrel protein [Calditrichota bacterium]MCB9088561.1 TIM barrel protein [Calditrichia bacterium]